MTIVVAAKAPTLMEVLSYTMSMAWATPEGRGEVAPAPPSDIKLGIIYMGSVGRAPNFVVTPNGEAIPVPNGASGPTAPQRGTGMSYQGGSGGNGMDPKTTGVRIMDANSNQGPRVNYMNEQGQTVNPATGRTIPKNDPAGHIPLKPTPPPPPPKPPCPPGTTGC